MARRLWLRGGTTLLLASLAVGALAACAAFDESRGDTSAEGGTNAEAGTESGGARDGGEALDGEAEAIAPIGVLTDAGADAAAKFPPGCTSGEQAEVEPNDLTGNVFTEAVCGTLGAVGDIDILVITLARTAPFHVYFSRSGNAKYTVQGPGVSFAAGGLANGGFTTATFSGMPGMYVIKISGTSGQSWNLAVHQD